jgi:hypothetical protein
MHSWLLVTANILSATKLVWHTQEMHIYERIHMRTPGYHFLQPYFLWSNWYGTHKRFIYTHVYIYARLATTSCDHVALNHIDMVMHCLLEISRQKSPAKEGFPYYEYTMSLIRMSVCMYECMYVCTYVERDDLLYYKLYFHKKRMCHNVCMYTYIYIHTRMHLYTHKHIDTYKLLCLFEIGAEHVFANE